jgi:hypothetical protein
MGLDAYHNPVCKKVAKHDMRRRSKEAHPILTVGAPQRARVDDVTSNVRGT